MIPDASPYSGKIRNRVCGLFYRVDTELLLIQVHVPTRRAPVWMVPGGGVEPGETLHEALFRECEEEVGIKRQAVTEAPDLVAVHEFIEPPFHAIEFYFNCGVVGSELVDVIQVNHQDSVLIQARWVPLQKLSEFSPEPVFLADPDFHHRGQIRNQEDKLPRDPIYYRNGVTAS